MSSPSRKQLLLRLHEGRRLTDALFAQILPDALAERPIAERHRFVFYVGHVDVFDWNLIVRDALGGAAKRPDFESLFAFGIDPIGGDVPTDAPLDWPSIEVLRSWIAEMRADVDRAVMSAPFSESESGSSRAGESEWATMREAPWMRQGWAVHIAIEHRLMHFETLSYLMSRLPLDRKVKGPLPRLVDGPLPDRRWIEIPAGSAMLGLSRAAHPYLGWDNEYEAHEVEVPGFRIDSHKVTNADFLRFLEDGGYQRRELWTHPSSSASPVATPANDSAAHPLPFEDDWSWRQRVKLEHPLFWNRSNAAKKWAFRGMFAEIPLPLSWPAWVSHAEARAYAKWRNARLPTEAEWHRAAYASPDGEARAYPWGNEAPVPGVHGNFGHVHDDPTPVGAHPRGASAFGVDELIGNGWEWTSTPFAAFEGFEPLPFYLGYSKNFFDGHHFVMKGGSPKTDASMLRRSFRNWFQPHYPHVYAGFRCVDARSTHGDHR